MSFREFVASTQSRLFAFTQLVAGDRGRAEDLLQDAYLAASVDAFGITGPDAATVTVTNRGTPLPVIMSKTRTTTGRRAFLVRYHFPRVADWVDDATARDATGTVLGTAQFVAPGTGTPAGRQPTATR